MTLGGSLAAGVASLGAIALDLASAPGERATAGDAAFTARAAALSWAFVHVLLAHHYKHEYWLGGGRGLAFPRARPVLNTIRSMLPWRGGHSVSGISQ